MLTDPYVSRSTVYALVHNSHDAMTCFFADARQEDIADVSEGAFSKLTSALKTSCLSSSYGQMVYWLSVSPASEACQGKTTFVRLEGKRLSTSSDGACRSLVTSLYPFLTDDIPGIAEF